MNEIDLSKLFQNENTKEDKTTAKELFKEKNIKTKTELGINEINLTARGFLLSKILKNYGYKSLSEQVEAYYNEILVLRVSLKRKSRNEFIEAMKSEIIQEQINEAKNESVKIR